MVTVLRLHLTRNIVDVVTNRVRAKADGCDRCSASLSIFVAFLRTPVDTIQLSQVGTCRIMVQSSAIATIHWTCRFQPQQPFVLTCLH